MYAIGATEFGSPEVLQRIELPRPKREAGQVLIRVKAATVNPTDLLYRSGIQQDVPGPPYIPGMEISGVLEEADESFGLKTGDAIIAITAPVLGHGGYAEYVVVPEAWVTKLPVGLTFPEAATLPMNGLTALLAVDWLALPEGSTLAVTGGTGAVGSYAIQLAHARGLKVITLGRDEEKDALMALGADTVIPRADDAVPQFLKVQPEGFSAVIDAAAVGVPLLEIVGSGGKFAALRDIAGLKSGTRQIGRGIVIHRIKVSDYIGRADKLREIVALVEQGRLKPQSTTVLAAPDAAEAHRKLEQKHIRGRLILQF